MSMSKIINRVNIINSLKRMNINERFENAMDLLGVYHKDCAIFVDIFDEYVQV